MSQSPSRSSEKETDLTSSGLFMKKIDWTDPKFSPLQLYKLKLNYAQIHELQTCDENIDFPDLTDEQYKHLCLNVNCRVELFHANVCYGVEKSWPKRMFKKPNFASLTRKEQRRINRGMQRKAVLLYNKYVDRKRLKERVSRQTSQTLARYYEEIYRRNLFRRMKASGEPEPGYDAVINDSVLVSNDSDEDLSQQTVINTGTTGTQESNKVAIDSDLNDNDCSDDVIIENDERPNGDWKSKATYTITHNYPIEEIVDTLDDNNSGMVASEYNVQMSETMVSSSTDDNVDQLYGKDINFLMPDNASDELTFATPVINRREHRVNEMFDADMDDLDSLDFLSQGMTAATSTQQ